MLKIKYLVFIILLTSCISNKKWQKIGFEKGWLDTTSKVSTINDIKMDFKIDTNNLSNDVDTTVNKIMSICDSLKLFNTINSKSNNTLSKKEYNQNLAIYKEKLKKQMKDSLNILLSKYLNKDKINVLFKDTSILINGNKIDISFKDNKLNVKLINKNSVYMSDLKWYQKYWYLFFFVGVLFVIIIVKVSNR